jgi:hypothetical protein
MRESRCVFIILTLSDIHRNTNSVPEKTTAENLYLEDAEGVMAVALMNRRLEGVGA